MKAPTRQTSAPVIEFLNRHDGAATLLPAAQRILKLRQDLLALMPASLRETFEVAGFDDETVVLKVSSAGAAAKLRQTLPRLCDGLSDRGWKVSAIRTRVQPGGSAVESTTYAAKHGVPMSAAGLSAFTALEGTLDRSPLRDAVERLVTRRSVRREPAR